MPTLIQQEDKTVPWERLRTLRESDENTKHGCATPAPQIQRRTLSRAGRFDCEQASVGDHNAREQYQETKCEAGPAGRREEEEYRLSFIILCLLIPALFQFCLFFYWFTHIIIVRLPLDCVYQLLTFCLEWLSV